MADTANLYASAPLQSLFAYELAMLAPILGGVFGNRGLFLRPHASAPASVPTHLLGSMIELASDGPRHFAGALNCNSAELPFSSESFKLVIAQHVLEQVSSPEQTAAEIARVLAPEGVALVLGFNPASPWRLRLSLLAARSATTVRPRSAYHCRELLMREQIDTLQIRYPGPWWPRAGLVAAPADESRRATGFGRLRSNWLLLARKRRSNLMPLRLRSKTPELGLKPQLAPGAHRACA